MEVLKFSLAIQLTQYAWLEWTQIIVCSGLMQKLDPACTGSKSAGYFMDLDNGELDIVIQWSLPWQAIC